MEIIILTIQLFMFYIFPLFAGPTDMMGMVVLILFIPSVFIHYNESALVHAIWYFIDSLIGMMIGLVISKIKK